MGASQINWRKGLFRVWLVAALVWAAVATTFSPLGNAVSAIWRNNPTIEEIQSMYATAYRSYYACMQQPPSGVGLEDIDPGRAHVSRCNALKETLDAKAAVMPRDLAWGYVFNFIVATIIGAAAIGGAMLIGAWVIGGFKYP